MAVIPFSLLRRALMLSLFLWLVARALFAFRRVWLPSTSASIFLVFFIVLVVRVDMWRSREDLFLRNLGIDPWALLGLCGLAVALAEWTARVWAASLGY